MPKCSCAGSACNCLITAGTGITVTGTGNSTAPYRISTSAAAFSADVEVAGPVDLSHVGTGSPVRLNLSIDAPEVSFPAEPTDLFEVVLHHTVAGTMVTWPFGVLWPGGTEPAQTADAGHIDWFLFRRVGAEWMGVLLAGDVF